MAIKTRISVPQKASADSIVDIKTLASHPMHSGFRRDVSGALIPRDILVRFECRYKDETVFAMDLKPGIAANPYISFPLRVGSGGDLEFLWIDQDGEETRERRSIVTTSD